MIISHVRFFGEDPAIESRISEKKMTVDNNPLYHEESYEDKIINRNRSRLYKDIERRDNPLHGKSYSILMDSMRVKNIK